MRKDLINTMNRIKLISLGAAALALSSCSDTTIRITDRPQDEVSPSAYIEFGNYVNTMTRASKETGNDDFCDGDTMAVWGEQTTGDVVDVIFNNQDVRFVEGTTWTYDNKKLWNIGSSYRFYGFFPYSRTLYTMSDDTRYITIAQYTTPDDPASQKDLMISELRAVSPFNTVDLIFHHILSNVNVSVKIAEAMDMQGVESVTLKSIKINNVKSTGSYAQTGWNQFRAVGSWSNVKNYMEIPAVTDLALTKSAQTVYGDYLIIPQPLFSADANPRDVTIDATFRIVYTDGTSSTFIKNGIRLAGIKGSNGTTSKVLSKWEPNYRYNYMLSFNPQVATRVWEADGDGSLQIDPETGDTLKFDDDTPTPGSMKYNPDEPGIIYVLEDADGDGLPEWVPYPIVWEDIDEDGLLEGGIDRDGDGHIDNIDGEDITQQAPGGDPDGDPSDGNPNNPSGKDVILVHYDSNGDGRIDDDDDWIQLQKDPTTGEIFPSREEENAVIQFTAQVEEWAQKYSVSYEVHD